MKSRTKDKWFIVVLITAFITISLLASLVLYKLPWHPAINFFVYLIAYAGVFFIPLVILELIDNLISSRKSIKSLRDSSANRKRRYNDVWNTLDVTLDYDIRRVTCDSTLIQKDIAEQRIEWLDKLDAAKKDIKAKQTLVKTIQKELKKLGYLLDEESAGGDTDGEANKE